MANTVISRPNVFPEGTVVKAYGIAAEVHANNGTAPDNLSSVQTKTVTGGVLTYTTLVAGTRYVLHGVVIDSGVTVENAGGVGEDEVDTVYIRGVNGRAITGGTFTISVDSGGGAETTAALPHDASQADVLLALEALASVDVGDVDVAGENGGPYTLTFGGTLAETAITTTVNVSNLVGASERRFLRISGSA